MTTVTATNLPLLVAHRGYAKRYPENTLPALEAALRAGVKYLEFDVQLTADGVPVLFHDHDLKRTTGTEGRITEITSDRLARLCAGEIVRLGPRFGTTPIPTLAALAGLLGAWPAAHAFVELKSESLAAFGTDTVIARVLGTLAPFGDRCTLISFDQDAMRRARAAGASGIGWVLTAWDDEQHKTADALGPDYLFCNHTKLPAPDTPLWPGPWRWAFYEVTDPALALALARRGASLIETMALDAFTAPPWSLKPADDT